MDLFCPICKTKISPAEKKCGSCSKSYLCQDGYIDYAPEDTYYWGELEQTDMKKLISEAQSLGYRKACFEHFKNHKRKSLFSYILSKNDRISFINFVYNRKRSERCLDLGSGFGTIPAGLSTLFKEVYSIENIKERILFQAIIKEQDGIKNWQIIKGDIRSLPFPDNYFDFISVNGVLEWIGLSAPKQNPRVTQLQFLKEIKRVLKPDGVCYVGIENRIGRQYFRGAIDHSGFPYTSLLPRPIATFVCRLKKKSSLFFHDTISRKERYLTYTYSQRGYRSLLRDIGILNPRIFHTAFSYNVAYAGMDDASVRYVPNERELIKNKLPQFKYAYFPLLAKVFSIFTPNFLIFFRKDDKEIRSELEEKILTSKSDDSPLCVYKGFNGLMAYSIFKKVFYKTKSITETETLDAQNKIEGFHPPVITEKIFEQIIRILKSGYYTHPTTEPEKFETILKTITTLAVKYGFDKETTAKYIASLDAYKQTAIFSKTHGDVWRENVIVTSSDNLKLIDEETDDFGIIPLEISRFILSVVGYSKGETAEARALANLGASTFSLPGISEKTITQFHLLALFYELRRRDIDIGVPRMELYTFADLIQQELKKIK